MRKFWRICNIDRQIAKFSGYTVFANFSELTSPGGGGGGGGDNSELHTSFAQP